MKSYLNLLNHIMTTGLDKADRTGTGTRSVFGYQFRHSLNTGFPLLTTKKIHFKSVAHELLWFISGSTNVQPLQAAGVHIWDEWARPDGELGPVYGYQWRNWTGTAELSKEKNAIVVPHIDQLAEAIKTIRTNPDSRRIIVSAWNPTDVPKMALPPCHALYQFYVGDGRVSCHMYQRSADAFLGVPFNIASYALLTHFVAHITGYLPGDLIISFGDLHVYNNHFEQVNEQLQRQPGALPGIELEPSVKEINEFRYEHIKLVDYVALPTIKAPIAV